MKVDIGPYLTWWGPYQIADLLQKVGVSEERCYKIGEWLADTKIADFCQWLYDKRKRKVKVKIHSYDVWNMDSTLCYIIHPMLLKLKEERCGVPFVRQEDVPEELQYEICFEADYDQMAKAWDWVMNEMIWAFDPEWEDKYGMCTDNYTEGLQERRNNGFRLFGVYFQSLWD